MKLYPTLRQANQFEITVLNGFSQVKRQATLFDYLAKKGVFKGLRADIEGFRAIKDPQKRKQRKLSFPLFTPVATFEKSRKGENLIKLNGLVFIDIDNLEAKELKRVRTLLTQGHAAKHVVHLEKSISGKGLHALIYCGKLENPDEYLSAWKAIERDFQQQGVQIDKATKDFTRAKLVSYDRDQFVNLDAVPFYGRYYENKKTKTQAAKTGTFIGDSKAVEAAFKIIESQGKAFEDGQRNDYIVSLAGLLNQFGVSLEEAETVCDKALNLGAFKEHAPKVEDIYRRYADQHGTKSYKNELVANKTIKIEKYLSEEKKEIIAAINKTSNVLIQAPTGSGKTEFVIKHYAAAAIKEGKSVLLAAPTTAIAKQKAEQYGAIYIGGGESSEEISTGINSNIAACTYATLARAARFFDDIILDEAHELETSGVHAKPALLKLLDKLLKDDTKKVIALTGTTSDSLNWVFKAVINIERNSHKPPPVEYYRYSKTKNKGAGYLAYKEIMQAVAKGRKPIIHLNNGTELNALITKVNKELPHGKKAYGLWAYDKMKSAAEVGQQNAIDGLKAYESLRISEKLPKDCAALIATSAIESGVNIHAKNDNITEIFISQEQFQAPQSIAQFFARVRTSKSIEYKPKLCN